MKRVIAVTTSFLMIFSLLFTSNATVASANDFESEFSVLKNTEEHKIFKLKNGETLEEFNTGEEDYYIANTGGDSFKIVKENDVVSVINLRNNQVVETYIAKEITDGGNMIEPVPSVGLPVLEKDFGVGTYQVTNPGNGSKYRYVSTRNMSIEIITTSISVAAGIIASIVGTKATGVIVTIATGYVGSKLKRLYWKEVLSEYKENVYLYRKWSKIFYKYHDYTSHLGTTVTYTKNRVW